MTDALRQMVTIQNERGLHARASAKFVQTLSGYDAIIRVSRGNEIVDGASIMDLLMLAAGPGTDLEIQASGAQAAEALQALCALVADKFGEPR